MTEPTEPIEAETWKCAGCGVPSPGRMRSCDCATNVVYQPDQPGSASAWKLERYDAAPIEADIALLRGAIRISRDVRDNTVPVANDRLSRLLDYVEGMSKGTDEKAWLIESFHAGYALWWSRTDNADDGVCGWSDDSLKAIRFSRSVDAQAIIDEHGWTEAHPSEHMWCDPTHKWAFFERFGFTSCEVCGIVRRADGANGPCKGPVSVGPRGALPPAPLHGKG